ncbi:uncharacterized protein LOC116343553 [Contarinia nasturtii]|uniref:uncharacterized protein LOC116343553 n=1 Tax=Contarinia nasturtii TaxID=265458 RepID=UPI0012D3C0D1|nr:uncharacterized protein LOC116343553 [Contarinia nasturtii]
MRPVTCGIVIAFLAFTVNGYDDPISILGRIRWNYTQFEDNLWTRQYKNTTLNEIYVKHSEFFTAINNVYNGSECFYPTFNATTVKKGTPVDIINPYHVPEIASVIQSNADIEEYWSKFANWSTVNASNMLEVLTDDAIPILQNSLDTLWNSSNTDVYFDFLKNTSESCTDIDEPQIAVYKLVEKYFFNTIVLHLKAYVMLQLSYLTGAAKDFLHFHKTARDHRVAFNSQYVNVTLQTENLMWNLSRIIWSCDKFSSNESYTQLTNFIQGYVDNEINMNADGSCAPYCDDFKSTKNYGCKEGTLCATNYLDHNKTRCLGTIRDCDYFGPMFSICPNENDLDINRRINFVQFASGKILGEEKLPCDFFDAKPFMSWLTTCRYCFCYCDAPGPRSDRHFSLRDVISNVAENKVISGIRIMKKNGIIHLEASERTLLPKNELDPNTKSIVSNNNFTINDPNVVENTDYFTMTYDNRILNLDTIVAKGDEIVTGVRFRVAAGSVYLEVRFTYYDEVTGKLDLTTDSEWKMNLNTNRTTISTEHSDVPTKLQTQSIAMGSDDTDAVRFVPTSWVKDMAQSTVPFIDSNLIEPSELAPLSGVGIFYKYQKGYGGFVAPRLITRDHSAAVMRIRGAVGVYGV